MKTRIGVRTALFSITLLGLSVHADPIPNFSPETLRSAAVSDKAVELPKQLSDVGHVLPMYEAGIVSRLCANSEYQAEIGKSKVDCSKAVYALVQECTKILHDKFPRADNAEADGRLSHRIFAASYLLCLKNQYATANLSSSQ